MIVHGPLFCASGAWHPLCSSTASNLAALQTDLPNWSRQTVLLWQLHHVLQCSCAEGRLQQCAPHSSRHADDSIKVLTATLMVLRLMRLDRVEASDSQPSPVMHPARMQA